MIQDDEGSSAIFRSQFDFIDENKHLIVVTGHRRENFGSGFEAICNALVQLASRPDVQIVYPVHLNPNVREPVLRLLSKHPNVSLIEPLDYQPFVYLMSRAYLILTDSGGIQEEAPSLGKPVLVMRDTTERPEAVDAGTVRLVGTDTDKIVNEVSLLLDSQEAYRKWHFLITHMVMARHLIESSISCERYNVADIVCSIVLYNHGEEDIIPLANELLASENIKKLVFVDNGGSEWVKSGCRSVLPI